MDFSFRLFVFNEIMAEDLNTMLTSKTDFLGLEVWEIIVLSVSLFIVLILCVLALCIISRSKSRRVSGRHALSQIPDVSGEIKEIHVVGNGFGSGNGSAFIIHDNPYVEESDSSRQIEMDGYSGAFNSSNSNKVNCPSPSMDLPEFSQLGWGHWFTLRDLELATNGFLKENIIGEGGYGVVFRGRLSNGTPVAVKKLLNNKGQAETEFRVEVEAIGNVRHKNLVRLLGYCIEGTHRLLVYDYIQNGNLEQWLHGTVDKGNFSWDSRMNVLLGTAKALAYLHEAIEPKVIHRDIKSSNILIDDGLNAKVSDFGLAKLMGAGKSHITTRVMGTFGYVAPEYANSGLLNEKSDVYSFGVVFLEAITGMDPVDYNRPKDKVNLVEWLKTMVAGRRSEEVVDPKIEEKPSTRELKRALLTALRCVDPDYEKRPRMSQVVRMMEPDEYPMPSERRRQRNQGETRGDEE